MIALNNAVHLLARPEAKGPLSGAIGHRNDGRGGAEFRRPELLVIGTICEPSGFTAWASFSVPSGSESYTGPPPVLKEGLLLSASRLGPTDKPRNPNAIATIPMMIRMLSRRTSGSSTILVRAFGLRQFPPNSVSTDPAASTGRQLCRSS